MTTLTIMRILPREVDPMVYSMSLEDPGGASFAGIGGLGEQVRELREVIELPLLNPELFTVRSFAHLARFGKVEVGVYAASLGQKKRRREEQWKEKTRDETSSS